MKQYNVIDQLQLIDGVLKCKTPSKRSWQEAHFKQGDLDGACGVYSVAMVLNIIGVFRSELLWNYEECDEGTPEWNLIKEIAKKNRSGLFKDGMASSEIKRLLSKTFSEHVSVEVYEEQRRNKGSLIAVLKKELDSNQPCILRIEFKTGAHWIAVVGYETDDNGNLINLLTLDAGTDSPTYACWNGILSLDPIPRVKYFNKYVSWKSGTVNVLFDEVVIIRKHE